MVINNPLYQEKLGRFNAMLNQEDPKVVPVLSIADVWVATNAGFTYREAYVDDPLKLKDAYKFYTENVYMDAHWSHGLIHPFGMLSIFGEGLFVFDDHGYQIVGGGSAVMEKDEYPEFMKNPSSFIADTLLPRKYKILKEASAGDLAELFYKAILEFAEFDKLGAEIETYLEETLGLPMLLKGMTMHPLDYILDFLRDFVGTMTDLRRQPENVIAACEVLGDMMLAMPKAMWSNPDNSGIVFMPLHIPTYLKPKDFEKFYFPWFKKIISTLNQLDYRLLVYCERDWTAYMDILQDLPEGKNAYMFENGDLKYICNKIKRKGMFVGGMPAATLKRGTKQESIDAAKKCLDDYAPGGKYIFTTDVALISKEDAKLENLAAAHEYIHVHGKY